MKHLIPFFVASAFAISPALIAQEHERGEHDRPVVRRQAPKRTFTTEEYRGIERRVKAAIESGRISKEGGEKRLIASRKMISDKKPQGQGRRGAAVEKKIEIYKDLAKNIEAAVGAGMMDEADAKKIMLSARKRIRTGGEKKREISRADFRRASAKVNKMVEAGEVSREAADKRLRAMRKLVTRAATPQRTISPEDYRKARGRVRSAIEAGRISKEDGVKRLEEMRRMLPVDKKSDDSQAWVAKALAKVKKAVVAGELTREQAGKKMQAIRERAAKQREMQKGEHDGGKRGDAKRDGTEKAISAKDYSRLEERIKKAVADGKLSKEDAESKLSAMRKLIRDRR